MLRPDHYALLVTINRYPGLSHLAGPENDGKALKRWLVDPEGGGLPEQNVKFICSADFDEAHNPDDANPTERELVRALNHWLRAPGGWKERVGARIYLYFAGHGFTAGSSISDPALFTAIAQIGDTAHIAGYRYASKIVNAGFFDEVVLLMDCCQDVLKASQVLDPTWSPPDRNQAANVKFFQAYGAPRGRKAFEEDLAAHGGTRGLFSTVWMEALVTAEADSEGWVSGTAVKNRFLKLWGDHYRQKTNYDPPVRLPDGQDILLYRRAPPAMPAPAPGIIMPAKVMVSRGIKVSGGIMEILDQPLDLDVTADLIPDDDVPHRAPSAPPPVRAVSVTLEVEHADIDMVVLDSHDAKLVAGTGTLTVNLLPGPYTALARVPGAATSQRFQVMPDQPMHLKLEIPAFSSAAPIEASATTHEYQRYPALERSVAPVPHDAHDVAELFVFVREARPNEPPPQAPPLRLVGLGHGFDLGLRDRCSVEPSGNFAWTKLALPAGTYGLMLDLSGHTEESAIAIAIGTAPGWRTDVYLEIAGDEDEQRVPNLQGATVLMAPIGVPSPLLSQEGRAAEVARLRFQYGKAVARPSRGASPLHVLFAAYACATAPTPDPAGTRACLDLLPDPIHAALPDVALLEAWCTAYLRQPAHLGVRARSLVPMVAAGWQLIAQLGEVADTSEAVDAIGQWRVAGSVWTSWWHPRGMADVIRRRLQRRQRGRGMRPTSEDMQPPWKLDTWKAVAAGLRSPVPGHSPFQQALRRRILDCIEDECEDDPVPPLAQAFGLPMSLAARGYGELYEVARMAQMAKQGSAEVPVA